jgi:hypothetical protein
MILLGLLINYAGGIVLPIVWSGFETITLIYLWVNGSNSIISTIRYGKTSIWSFINIFLGAFLLLTSDFILSF